MKGIILATRSETLLHPSTLAMNKPLIPIYNKPMIYYPLSTLMLAGIREVLVVTTPNARASLQRLFGNGHHLGLAIDYAVPSQPGGPVQALLDSRQFIGDGGIALALVDNVFFGHGFPAVVRQAAGRTSGATVFAHWVGDAERDDVVAFDDTGRPVRLGERAVKPRSSWAVTGLYFHDNTVLDVAARLRSSARREIEMTEVNSAYLAAGALHVEKLGRGIAWLETTTHEAVLQASSLIQTIEERQGLMVACVEEIAFAMGYIGAADVRRIAEPMRKNSYGQYLLRLLESESGVEA